MRYDGQISIHTKNVHYISCLNISIKDDYRAFITVYVLFMHIVQFRGYRHNMYQNDQQDYHYHLCASNTIFIQIQCT